MSISSQSIVTAHLPVRYQEKGDQIICQLAHMPCGHRIPHCRHAPDRREAEGREHGSPGSPVMAQNATTSPRAPGARRPQVLNPMNTKNQHVQATDIPRFRDKCVGGIIPFQEAVQSAREYWATTAAMAAAKLITMGV